MAPECTPCSPAVLVKQRLLFSLSLRINQALLGTIEQRIIDRVLEDTVSAGERQHLTGILGGAHWYEFGKVKTRGRDTRKNYCIRRGQKL